MATAKKKGLPLSSHPRHADDAEARRGTPRRRVALLGDQGRDRGARKADRDEPFRDKDGIGRCRLVMQPKVIAVSRGRCARSRAGAICRGFAPPDLTKSSAASVASMPEPMRRNCAISGCCKAGLHKASAAHTAILSVTCASRTAFGEQDPRHTLVMKGYHCSLRRDLGARGIATAARCDRRRRFPSSYSLPELSVAHGSDPLLPGGYMDCFPCARNDTAGADRQSFRSGCG